MAEAQMTATMSESQGLGGTKSSLGVTKSLGGGELGGTKELQTTVKESMSLIDRFYNGGNTARPEALNILVVVLDSVVRRIREQKDTRQRKANDIDDEVKTLNASLAAVRKLREPLERDLAEKRERAKQLQTMLDSGVNTINDSVATAREALDKARLAQRIAVSNYSAGMKLSQNGYDGKGRPLPGARRRGRGQRMATCSAWLTLPSNVPQAARSTTEKNRTVLLRASRAICSRTLCQSDAAEPCCD